MCVLWLCVYVLLIGVCGSGCVCVVFDVVGVGCAVWYCVCLLLY